MADLRKLFGSKVRSVRKELGWSQAELADACELDRTYIGGIERGECNISLLNIAQALKVKANSLIEF
jgi:transcriptional regulator with XRE-family HTH domain